jgi:ATP-binding cassette, subfamily B, vacuolar membrane transporter HMT1/ACLQ
MAELDAPRREGQTMPNSAARRFIDIFQLLYPVILLFFFLFAFCAQTIITSRRNSTGSVILYGPGGNPLPGRRTKKPKADVEDFPRNQKLTFIWFSLLVCVTFVANAANVIVHALDARKSGWWCGQPPVVSRQHRPKPGPLRFSTHLF